MGLNASAAFSFLNLNNNAYQTNHKENSSAEQHSTINEAPSLSNQATTLGDSTYSMPQSSIYDTAGTVAYNYYNNSFSAGTSSSGGAETAGSIASSSGGSVSFSSSGGASSSSSSSGASGGTAGSIA